MSKLIDITGQTFNYLTVVSRAPSKNGKAYWKCKCKCGNECIVNSFNLRSGNTKSCGCLKKEKIAMIGKSNNLDLTNQRFGHLIALKPTEKRSGSCIVWQCLCDCGKITYVASSDLRRGSTKSCGCMKGFLNGEKHKIDMIGKRFGKLIVLKQDSLDTDGSYNYLCQCDCGNKKIVNGVNLRQGSIQSCGCINYSIGEQNIEKILKQNNILYKHEYIVKELNNKRFDFAIINNKNQIVRLIEFDGKQHYEKYWNKDWEDNCPLEVRQKRDREKNQWAKQNNIPLVRIPYWERDNINLEMLLGNKYLIK